MFRMQKMTCDRCGKLLLIDESVRYEVVIEVKSAYDPMEITISDLARDKKAEIKHLINRIADADPQELADQVYKRFIFDLCPKCQREYIRNPIPHHEQPEEESGGADDVPSETDGTPSETDGAPPEYGRD